VLGTSRPHLLDVRLPALWPSKRPIGGGTPRVGEQGNLLLHRGTDPKELAHFIKSATKACCRGHTSEPTHRVIALLDATVVLLQSIVEIAIGPVEHVTAQGLADRSWIGVMAIGRHPLWGMTNDIDGLLEKALGRLHISLLGSASNQPDCHLDRWRDTDSTIFP
jgi:hypothetical protein